MTDPSKPEGSDGENANKISGTERLEIGLTDYEKPLFCSGCNQEFNVGETLHVADLGSAFPTFCSSECAFEGAEKYHVEHLVDERDGIEFVRLVGRSVDTETDQ